MIERSNLAKIFRQGLRPQTPASRSMFGGAKRRLIRGKQGASKLIQPRGLADQCYATAAGSCGWGQEARGVGAGSKIIQCKVEKPELPSMLLPIL